MSEFQIESRYLVLERSDIETYLDDEDKIALGWIAECIAMGRTGDGRERTPSYAVVRSTWDNYSHTCKTIEQVAKGAFADPHKKIKELETRIAELESRCAAYEMAVDTMDKATRRAYISGAATVHHIRQIVSEAQAGAIMEGE